MVHSPPTSSYTRQAIAYMHTLDLTGQLVKLEPYSFACGEYANVYKADWVGKYSTNPVNMNLAHSSGSQSPYHVSGSSQGSQGPQTRRSGQANCMILRPACCSFLDILYSIRDEKSGFGPSSVTPI
jgi:hypothetical protein